MCDYVNCPIKCHYFRMHNCTFLKCWTIKHVFFKISIQFYFHNECLKDLIFRHWENWWFHNSYTTFEITFQFCLIYYNEMSFMCRIIFKDFRRENNAYFCIWKEPAAPVLLFSPLFHSKTPLKASKHTSHTLSSYTSTSSLV